MDMKLLNVGVQYSKGFVLEECGPEQSWREGPFGNMGEGRAFCPEGQDIAMGNSRRRTGTGILRFPGTVDPSEFPARQFPSRRDTGRKPSQLAGDVVEDPVGVSKLIHIY